MVGVYQALTVLIHIQKLIILLAVGLDWKLSIVAVVVGMSLMAIIISINGMIGARHNIPFVSWKY
jgi:cytosine/uracil/thiamine/allantoin permease